VEMDSGGNITAVSRDLAGAPEGAESLTGVLIPGVPNCHSHAFQRAMVGLTERRGDGEDSFWSWREAMYRLLENIGPEELQAIAAQLYLEMLKQGYTSVAEFHYLHHDRDGSLFNDPAEMSHRVIAAARGVGIQITHLPVLYCHSDFGAAPPEEGQRRFVHAIEDYQALLQSLYKHYGDATDVQLGIAPHSLRAVSKPLLREALTAINSLDDQAPIHIHIAEQEREVESCLVHNGMRPVAWLLDHLDVDRRWCLVHATHINDEECRDMAGSGAVAGLCPTTEANLGDGIFPVLEYVQAGGRFAVGSDSQVSLDPAGELRLLEYGQRLSWQRRTLLSSDVQASVGEFMFRCTIAGGAQALGIKGGEIAAGARADLVVLDHQHPTLYGKQGSMLLDSWIFGCNSTPVKDVMVGGEWKLRDGVHPEEEAVAERYRRTIDTLALTAA